MDMFDYAPMCYPKEKEQKFSVRTDELGRIKIPKEILRQLRIRQGEPLEIVVDGGKIIIKEAK